MTTDVEVRIKAMELAVEITKINAQQSPFGRIDIFAESEIVFQYLYWGKFKPASGAIPGNSQNAQTSPLPCCNNKDHR